MNKKDFVKHVKDTAKLHGIKVKFSTKDPYLTNSVKGYFDDVEKLLVISQYEPSWFEILVHEYSHVEQWIKNPIRSKIDLHDLWDDWLDGKIRLSKKEQEECFRFVRDTELDCEKMAVKNIIKFNLSIDVTSYIKMANYYLFSHLMMKRKKLCQYKSLELYEMMSEDFQNNYDRLPRGTLKLFLEDAI